MRMSEDTLKEAHEHSSANRREIRKSSKCCCICCMKTYPAEEVEDWVGAGARIRALCPLCGVDGVIGDASGLDIESDWFLDEMNKRWFDGVL